MEPQPGTCTLDPLAYYKLKSTLFEIGMLESQIREQLGTLAQRKQAVLAEAGFPPANYMFTDATCTVTAVESNVPALPSTATATVPVVDTPAPLE